MLQLMQSFTSRNGKDQSQNSIKGHNSIN
ncbi:uncharacterized protein METZ01_LOCUS107820 [marine metagenome]|uniref:Uncharacterized protein n=1 Tax=marine metagenome TaxID=408172 RepID=A0A381WR17_9ZZZZ